MKSTEIESLIERARESADAQLWAQALVEMGVNHPTIMTDTETLTGWFANAMMSQLDHRNITPDPAQIDGFFDRCESLEEVLFQLMGAASVCWETLENSGIFQSDRAHEIGVEAIRRLTALGISLPNTGKAEGPFVSADAIREQEAQADGVVASVLLQSHNAESPGF